MSEDDEISLAHIDEAPPRSLARMLTDQYSSKEFLAILGATELRETEIIGLSGVMSTRFVSLVMSTLEEDLIDLKGEELQKTKALLLIKKRILRDPNAMVYVIQDSFVSGLVLSRQSLKRQSRKEAMQIASNPRLLEASKDVGVKDRLFSKLGVSRKYDTAYSRK